MNKNAVLGLAAAIALSAGMTCAEEADASIYDKIWGYGTFILGHEHVHEPLRRLEEAQRRMQPSFPVQVLKMGETLIIDERSEPYSAQTDP